MTYTIRQITHKHRKPFKDVTLWWLFMGDKRVHSFPSRADAMRGAKVLAKRWPATIVTV